MNFTFSNIGGSVENNPQALVKSAPERLVFWMLVLAPLWWLAGIQPLFYPLFVSFMLVRSFSFDKLTRISIPISIWAWLAMSLMMLWSTLQGVNDVGFTLRLFAASMVTFIKSYWMIFAGLIVPFWCRVRWQVVTRAVSWLSSGFLVTIAIELALLYSGLDRALGIDEGIKTPLAYLAPDSQSLRVFFADVQPFFGIEFPRTALYTADPPILGVCSILCFFICLGETNPCLRNFAIAGSLAGLVLSFSRLAWICFLLALLILGLLQNRLVRQSFLWIASGTAAVCGVLSIAMSELFTNSLSVFHQARQSSSIDRARVISRTLEAWQEAPWFGWGIAREAVKWYIYEIQLGSFSTYAAVLYLHGIVGFCFLIVAMLLTLQQFWLGAIDGNPLHQRAVASLVALYVLLHATPLSWMAVYFWFFFFWLGSIMAATQREPIESWKQLAQRPL